jgi:hypothetical protein
MNQGVTDSPDSKTTTIGKGATASRYAYIAATTTILKSELYCRSITLTKSLRDERDRKRVIDGLSTEVLERMHC